MTPFLDCKTAGLKSMIFSIFIFILVGVTKILTNQQTWKSEEASFGLSDFLN